MQEVEVVTDVRPSADSPELVLVKRRLVAEGGELRVVGEPTKTRVDVAARRVAVTLEEVPTAEAGDILRAHVRNVGLVPVDVTAVALEYEPTSTDNGSRQSPLDRIDLAPVDWSQAGTLQPGQARDWYLPPDGREEAGELANELAPERYRVVVRSGVDEVGCLPGAGVRPLFATTPAPGQVRLRRRAGLALAALSGEEEQEVLRALAAFQSEPATQADAGAGRRLFAGEPVYLVPVPGRRNAVVRRFENGAVEVLDLLPEDAVPQFLEGEAGAAVPA